MTPARLLEALRRLLGRAPSDWMGPDPARREAAAAKPAASDHFHDIVVLGGAGSERDALATLAARGHRVFVVSERPAPGGRAFAAAERSPRTFDVELGADRFAGLDALRREHALGATVVLGATPAEALTRRLEAELGWPAALPNASGDLAAAFPLLSIVVVTWNNRDLNRVCLDSVLARTEWPRREVVVVDNGSTDGTAELLRTLAERDASVRPVFLPENRGYPAAANAGLAAARGRWLVLLNNDTVVTRGWASTLVRHLVRDPRLGLVGPVTNAIANAAKVEVGYRGLDDLAAWAASWTRAHDSETFAIPSLAFFCVAMPRAVYETVGPLDARFGIGMFEDGDYCRRVRAAGYDVRCARDAFVHHWQMASFRTLGREEYLRLFDENRRRFEEKWGRG